LNQYNFKIPPELQLRLEKYKWLKLAFILAFDFWINAWYKIDHSLPFFKFLFISGKKSRLNLKQEFLTNFVYNTFLKGEGVRK
jgi:hypothetical protein